MSIITWIVLGLIAGFIASKFVNKTGAGVGKDVLLGACGALIGGGLFNALGFVGVTGLTLRSIFVSVAGAATLLIAYHALQDSRAS